MDQLALTPIHHRWLRCVPLAVALLRLRGPRLASGAPRRQAFLAHLGSGSQLEAQPAHRPVQDGDRLEGGESRLREESGEGRLSVCAPLFLPRASLARGPQLDGTVGEARLHQRLPDDLGPCRHHPPLSEHDGIGRLGEDPGGIYCGADGCNARAIGNEEDENRGGFAEAQRLRPVETSLHPPRALSEKNEGRHHGHLLVAWAGQKLAAIDALGSGKWAAGVAARIGYKGEFWNIGAIAGQRWSFAGDSDRAEINALLIRGSIHRGLGSGWFFVSAPIINANWNASSGNRWLVPLGGGFGKTFGIGSVTWAASVQAYANVIKPNGAPDWSLRLAFIAPVPVQWFRGND